MAVNTIVIIRIISAVLFLIAFFVSAQIYSKTKRRTDIWLLISAVILVLFADSLTNAVEWAGIAKDAMDIVGEYLTITFSLIWVYISFRFISESKTANVTK